MAAALVSEASTFGCASSSLAWGTNSSVFRCGCSQVARPGAVNALCVGSIPTSHPQTHFVSFGGRVAKTAACKAVKSQVQVLSERPISARGSQADRLAWDQD